jgi:nucleotide-binding universal stress UspA family protein
MYKKILVPLDGSELAEIVLRHAVPLAKLIDAEIILFRVVTLPVSAYMVVTEPRLAVGLREDVEAEAKEYLDGIAAKLRAEGIKASTEIGTGVVAETVQDFAKNIHADLIAMSTHGRGGLARMMIGSVADQLVRDSHLPVLLIRPQ